MMVSSWLLDGAANAGSGRRQAFPGASRGCRCEFDYCFHGSRQALFFSKFLYLIAHQHGSHLKTSISNVFGPSSGEISPL